MKNYSTLSDNELCKLAENDKVATEYLLRKYSPLVKQIARGFFLIGADNDDLIQEGMLGLFNAIMSYDEGKSSFKTYCTNCIKNAMKDAVKADQTKKNQPLNNSVSYHQSSGNEENTFLLDLFTSSIDSLDVISQQEDYQTLISYIKTSLTEQELNILKLYLEGKTYQEIAKILGIDYKKVDNSIQKMKKKLK